MSLSVQHRMNLVKTYPSGVLEWKCPDCSYHFLMQATPFKKLTLDEGDSWEIQHSGSTVNWLTVGALEMTTLGGQDPGQLKFLTELLT